MARTTKTRLPAKKRRATYTVEALKAAVDEGGRTRKLRSAARKYGVPIATMFRAIHNVNIRSKPGKRTILTVQEETRIETWVLYMARAGFPISMTDLNSTVAAIAAKLRKNCEIPESFPSKNWSARFLERHPKIKKKVTTNLPKAGANVTEQNLRTWFQEVVETLAEMGIGLATFLAMPPECFFNFDESGWELVAGNYTALCPQDVENAYCASNNSSKESFTVMFGGNAKGEIAPPLILYPGQRNTAEIAQNTPAGWSVGFSEEGWQTAKTFYEYVVNIFYKWLQQKRLQFPVLLFLDGHTSHISVELTEFCVEHNIILISLFPNATRILQPLDRSFFGPFKKNWSKMLHQFHIETRNARINKANFGGLIKRAFDNFRGASECLKRGFDLCGLYPWNPDAIDYSKLLTNVSRNEEPETVPAEHPTTLCEEEPENLYKEQLGYIEAGLEAAQIPRFNNNRYEEFWYGPIEELALFNFWKRFKDMSEGLLPTDPLTQYQVLQIEDYVVNDEGECISSGTAGEVTAEGGSISSETAANVVNDDVLSQTLDTERSASQHEDSLLRDIKNLPEETDAFEDTLVWPRVDEKKPDPARKKKEHVPAVASSERWRKWYKDKEAVKVQKLETAALRKEERERTKIQKEAEKALKQQEKMLKQQQKALEQQEKAENRKAKKKVLRA